MALPHDNVYARIGKSKIHGVGVVAIREIPQGTYIFGGDEVPMLWVSKDELTDLPEGYRQLYEDFAVRRGRDLGCPRSFNELTPSWYLNHSDKPNVAANAAYEFFAIRDIPVGEELTIDYESFSEGAALSQI